ncbi:MAG: hypothetical protein PHI37_02270 [Candidatus Gracilibacteria bacterium]|nr:hypothetical protein [Candidatus Gracilibacteria bacterium]
MPLLIFHNYNIMHPILVDKENALSSVQKIIKLVSSGKVLRIEEVKKSPNPKMQKSLDNALKEYEKGEYTTLLSIK